MRIIRFRAWDTEREIWVNPIHHDLYDFDEICENPRFKVMQFTGLPDRNGKDVWEGDIGRLGEYTCVLEWDDREARFWWLEVGSRQWITGRPSDAEIIGNCHEHPALLKEGV